MRITAKRKSKCKNENGGAAGRQAALDMDKVWLILQRVTRSENSAYSSSVKRVLITRLRWGVLYLFMAVNLLSWVDFFKRRKPQKAGLGWQPQQDSHRTK